MAAAWPTRCLPGEPVPDGTDDVLVRLRDAGFLGFDGVEDGDRPGAVPRDRAGARARGRLRRRRPGRRRGDGRRATSITSFELPLVVGDVYDPTAADAGSRGDDVAELRDSDLSETVSTVNDLERPLGPVTVALAVADLLRIPPVVGHYGIGRDTVRLPESATS